MREAARHSDTPLRPQPAARTAATLDYGRSRRPWRAGKRHAVLLGLLLVCAAGSWTVGREARQRTQSLLYARQAARHVESAGTVVFEPDPARAEALVRAGTHRPLAADAPAPVARIEPDSFRTFRDALATPSFEAMGALVFLHELTTPSGARRVVAVHFLPYMLDGRDLGDAGLVARIFEPGGFLRPPSHVGDAQARLLVPVDPPAAAAGHAAAGDGVSATWTDLPYKPLPLRWFAGQPDAADPSHFTLDYELDGVHGTVDGYLTDDGGSVRMQARDAGDRPAAAGTPVAEASYRTSRRG